jgi:hypothetical protein
MRVARAIAVGARRVTGKRVKTNEKRFWYVFAALVVLGGILFPGMLLFGYMSDEWG